MYFLKSCFNSIKCLIYTLLLSTVAVLAGLPSMAAASSKPSGPFSEHTSCRMTKQTLDGDLNGAASPDNVCLDEFGEGWVFASPRLNAIFALSDLKRARSGAVGWCKHPLNNCSAWASSNRASDATVCTVARNPSNNTGILGMRNREQCNQQHPIWCCQEKPKGGLQ